MSYGFFETFAMFKQYCKVCFVLIFERCVPLGCRHLVAAFVVVPVVVVVVVAAAVAATAAAATTTVLLFLLLLLL